MASKECFVSPIDAALQPEMLTRLDAKATTGNMNCLSVPLSAEVSLCCASSPSQIIYSHFCCSSLHDEMHCALQKYHTVP